MTCFSQPCQQRVFNKGLACVCNATYCDTFTRVSKLEENKLYTYVTSEDGLRMDLKVHFFTNTVKATDAKFSIHKDVVYQEILGFGGAMTDAAGMNIASLSKGARRNLLASYFGPGGAEYSFIRVPIGGTDYSTRPYTYCDDAEDLDLTCFRLAKEDEDYKVPYIKEALRISKEPVRLLTAAWNAPTWMLTKDFLDRDAIAPRFYSHWANYHKRFLEEYAKHDIHFWGITGGNEPTFAPGMVSWANLKDHQSFINQHLGPILKKSKFSNVSLLLCDDMTPYLPFWQDLLKHPATESLVAGAATHWYLDPNLVSLIQDNFHNAFPGKVLISSEACICEFEEFYEQETSWQRGERYGDDILEKLEHWSMAWIDWNFALDMIGGPNYLKNYCDSPIRVDATKDEFYKQPMYFFMAHFSKFIPPGSRRVEMSFTPSRPLKAVSFKTPAGHLVTVLLNKEEKDYSVLLCKGNSSSCASVSIPKKSITTAYFV